MDSIYLGIVSGILTSAILFVVVKLFNDSFMPWYRQYLYHGINISGTWHCHSALTQKIVLELDQNCQFIKGNAIVVKDDEHREEGRDSIRIFHVSGEIKDRFILLTMNSKDKKRLGILSLLMEVSGDGTVLSGTSSAYNPSRSQIEPHFKSFYRNESLAAKDRNSRMQEFNRQMEEMFSDKSDGRSDEAPTDTEEGGSSR